MLGRASCCQEWYSPITVFHLLFNEMLLFAQYHAKKHNPLSLLKRDLGTRGVEEIHTNQKLNKWKPMKQEVFKM